MTTLADRDSINRLAGILHAAMALGSQMWNGGGDDRSKHEPRPDGASRLSNDLLALFTQLNERRIPYLLVGGVALLKYIEGRNTDDVDLIVAAEKLHVDGLEVLERNPDAARASFHGLRVDLLFTSNPVFRLTEQRYATTHRFEEVDVRCATVEGLVLLKLYALGPLYRQGDLQRAALYETDVTMLCQRYHPDIAAILGSIRPHVSDGDFAELQRIAKEIQQRLERMERSKGTQF